MTAAHPGEQPNLDTNPEELLLLKETLLTLWSQLPAEHQATMALVLLDPVRESGFGPWLRETSEKQWSVEAPINQTEVEFPEWMEQVDQAVWSMVGCSVYDLPDRDFSSLYDDGMPSSEAALAALKEAGFRPPGLP